MRTPQAIQVGTVIAERYCGTRDLLAAATGLSKWQLKGIYRVTRDTPECPFSAGGRGGYPSRILAWHRDHITFSADRVLKNLPDRRPAFATR